MGKSEGQGYNEAGNELWVDLHGCSTAYAAELFDLKVKEAYKYGLSRVRLIYGTPDIYEGSIQEAYDEIQNMGHELIEGFMSEHAAVTLLLKENPSPEPKDEDMFFSGMKPEYDKTFWRSYSYLYPLYPHRRIYSASEIADYIGASVELVRAIAGHGYDDEKIPDAELRTVYDEEWDKNLTKWHFTNRSLEKFKDIWAKLSEIYGETLREVGASEDEIVGVLKTIKSIPRTENVLRSAKALLTRFRKRQDVE